MIRGLKGNRGSTPPCVSLGSFFYLWAPRPGWGLSAGQHHLGSSSDPGLVPVLLSLLGHTTLLWWTSGLMVSWTTNHVALRRMKAEMRFQWMMFLRHRMLLGQEGAMQADDRRERMRD